MSFCPVCRETYPDDWKRCPKDESTLLSGPNIGKYRIDRVIGVGGMGTVYRAFNPDTQSPVAIKMLHASAAADEAARERFRREAAAVAALRTRHVIRIYDFGSEPDGAMYLVMELLVGHNLRPEIEPLAAKTYIARINMILDGALRGLGAAHRSGVTHRDLKPENIFIADTDDGEVAKLLDFGIARVDSADQRGLTQSGALMGTPAYMAPEQIAGDRGPIGPWTDVYAMGVILHEMFAGSGPFRGDTVTEILSRVLSRDHESLRQVRSTLPEPVLAVADRAIASDHSKRFPDADAMRAAWQEAYDSFDPAERQATVPRFRIDASRHGTADTEVAVGVAATDLALTPGSRPAGSESPTVASSPGAKTPTTGPTTGRGSGRDSGRARRRPSGERDPSQPDIDDTDDDVHRDRKRGAPWAAVAAAVLVVGGGIGAALWATSRGGGGEAAPPDAAAAIAIDAGAGDAGDGGPNGDDGDAGDAGDAGGPETWPDPPDGMVALAGGVFEMGTQPGEFEGYDVDLVHQVELAPFWLDKTEVTVAAFRTVRPWTPLTAEPDLDEPVRNVSFADARAVCAAQGKRLPTEAEWEFAATRAPLEPAAARMLADGVTGPAQVATHPGDCTPDGVCDLLGNVSEWTADPWRDAAGRVDRTRRAVRGASYHVAPTATWYASPYARLALRVDDRDPEVGFRCARTIPLSPP